eukprot:314286-Amphidinium_carterae.1
MAAQRGYLFNHEDGYYLATDHPNTEPLKDGVRGLAMRTFSVGSLGMSPSTIANCEGPIEVNLP